MDVKDIAEYPIECLEFRDKSNHESIIVDLELSGLHDEYDYYRVYYSKIGHLFIRDSSTWAKNGRYVSSVDGGDIVVNEDKHNKWICEKEIEKLLKG